MEEVIPLLKDVSGLTVICTEVLEHNSPEEISSILSKLEKLNYDTIIFTTPNKKFNANYNLPQDTLRHIDHKQEFTVDEVKVLLEGYFQGSTKSYMELGDKVNGEASTIAVIVSKLESYVL